VGADRRPFRGLGARRGRAVDRGAHGPFGAVDPRRAGGRGGAGRGVAVGHGGRDDGDPTCEHGHCSSDGDTDAQPAGPPEPAVAALTHVEFSP